MELAMNKINGKQIKTLLWKEYRQIRIIILLPAILLSIPYMIKIYNHTFYIKNLQIGMGMMATFLTCFLAGGICYGMEFWGHTRSYLSTRPVSAITVFLIKIIMGLVLCYGVAIISVSLSSLGELGKMREDLPIDYLNILNSWWITVPAVFLASLIASMLVPLQFTSIILAFFASIISLQIVELNLPLSILIIMIMVVLAWVLAVTRMEDN